MISDWLESVFVGDESNGINFSVRTDVFPTAGLTDSSDSGFVSSCSVFAQITEKEERLQWGAFYLFIADFFAIQIIGGAKELVVLL